MTFDEWLAEYVKSGQPQAPAHMAALAWEAALAVAKASQLPQNQSPEKP